MEEAQSTDTGPDLALGVAVEQLADGEMLAGHIGEEAVLLARRGDQFFAIGATCSHYGGPLAQGLMVDDTVRCPWHHACFSLRTGEALHAPAFSPVPCWSTEVRDGKVFVRTRKEAPAPIAGRSRVLKDGSPSKIVIIGGGAAGFAAAEKLRREHYEGSIVMLSSEDASPVDRPNLSKDYLAGNAPEEWIPLRPDDFYSEQGIELRLGANVTRIDVASRQVLLDDASKVPYDRLLIATGAEPVRLPLPGIDLPHVYTLRSLADSRAIIERAKTARRAVVMGASFIGLEVAASLRTRGIEVHVVAPEKRPMERILGREMGDFVRGLHEEPRRDLPPRGHGDRDRRPAGQAEKRRKYRCGAGGCRRRRAAANHACGSAGLAVDSGVVVNEYLETSAPGVFAAGDIARWPDRRSGESIRVEHWVVAERQGQIAALNLLGRREEFDAVPFFWSQHYDVPINYVGHAESWDELTIEGDITARDCLLRYRRNGRDLAVASIYRDVASLQAELAMERS